MDHQSTTAHTELKCIICDEKVEPKALSLSLLKEITNDFSKEREIGRGGFAVVYKGVLDNGAAIAVKRILHTYTNEKQFNREVECLLRVKHKNVVRFIGYCVDSQGKAASYNGKFVMSEELEKLLCFEYLPHGTLDKYITDASCGLGWRSRYKVINGICDGLHYLHQNQVLHLDLKPPNILLDGNMLPKIADFGLSRRFDEDQSRANVTNIGGTRGYLAPEFSSREISYRFDLYSLGVIIIEIVTGKKGYEDVNNVLESWSNRLEESHKDVQLEQIRVCTVIGIECMEFNPAKRPASMQHIIARLHQTGNTEGSIETDLARSSPLQVETDSDDPHEGGEPGGISSEDFSFSWSSIFSLDRTMSEQTSEVVVLAVTKISFILGDDATKAIIAKLSEEVSNLKELPVKVEQIRKQLTVMGSVIRQIGTAYLTDKDAKSWIGDVRNVAFHVEDVMDKYSYYVLQLQKEGFLKNFFIEGTHYVKVFSEIAEEVVAVEKEILQVIEIKDQWLERSQLVPNQLIEMEIQRSQDSFPEFVKNESLVGIEDNRILLTRWLYSEEPESTVIAVWGMGGIGKTTLVRHVYEREKINFHVHAWIDVSQTDAAGDLLRKLLWEIGYTEQPLRASIERMDVHDMKKDIQQILGNRKCLIVLDNVWTEEVYFQMHDGLQNLYGTCILITTRNADAIGSASPTRLLRLHPLSEPDAFDLFCRWAFNKRKNHMCSKELETIATSIVHMCHGLPLLIVIIGSMFSSQQRLDIWTQQYNRLRSELSNNNYHYFYAVLHVIYSYLAGDVRGCLLYCSLFPEDHPMSRDSLVRMWVAEGLVLSKEKKTAEVVADGILKELIHRNLLELVDDDEFGRVNSCKMHDLVHELVTSIAEEEGFYSRYEGHRMIDMERHVRRLSLWGWKNDTGLKVKLPSLRTVVSIGEILSSDSAMLSSILSESIYLTVLELQDSEVAEVPASVGSLFNLRYIGLRRTKVKSLPESIKNLSNLHTLDIRQTEIEKLPRGIVKIRMLRHLLADRYDDKKHKEFSCFVGVQAPENLSNLQQLETLEVVESSNDLAVKLRKLMQLRSVWIDNISAADCANLFATLSDMPLLSSLVLSAKDENETLCFKALNPRSTELCRLTFRGQWVKGTLDCPIFRCHGPNLKYLDLSWCDLGKDPLGMLAPYLPNITYLKLANMHSANTLIICADYFPNLKTLVLNRMPDVRGLNIMDGALSCIEGLYIISLSMFDTLPRGIASLHSLKKLWLLDLHKDFIRQWYTSGMHQKLLHVSQIRV